MVERPLLVKKYGNRRLYDTEASRYITLDELAELIKSGRDVKIIDAKTKADLTKMVLLQIISDQEKERDLLPISFLKKMIQLGDESMRESLPRYLAFSLDAFVNAQKQFERRYQNLAGGFLNPMMWLAQSDKRPDADPPDLALDEAVEDSPLEAGQETAAQPAAPIAHDDQIRALKEQVDQIQALLSQLAAQQDKKS